jgi:hypothetical protein
MLQKNDLEFSYITQYMVDLVFLFVSYNKLATLSKTMLAMSSFSWTKILTGGRAGAFWSKMHLSQLSYLCQ